MKKGKKSSVFNQKSLWEGKIRCICALCSANFYLWKHCHMWNSLILLQDLDLKYHQISFQATLRGSDRHSISIWEHTNGLQKVRNQQIKSKSRCSPCVCNRDCKWKSISGSNSGQSNRAWLCESSNCGSGRRIDTWGLRELMWKIRGNW